MSDYTPSANAPIGIFDSGIGGLTITQCINQLLPNEDIIYIADNSYAPYGEKKTSLIIERVNQVADYFVKQQVKAIVIACNTATVNAIDQLRQRIHIPIIGVEPAIKPAALLSKAKKVGILVTQATAKNKRFLDLVENHKNGADVFIQPCPGLVEIIEQGNIDDDKLHALLTQFIQPLIDKNIDTLVLGCTHYPIVEQNIKQHIGANITLMDTAKPVTLQLQNQLTAYGLTSTNTAKQNYWFSTKKMSSTPMIFQNMPWQTISI